MRYATSTLAILLFFSSCADNSKSELAVFKATTNSLELSSKTINSTTADFRKQLFDRLHIPGNAEQAAVWQPKAAKVSELASLVIEYISILKSQLTKEGDNLKLVNKVFFQQNEGAGLYRRLRNFMDTIYTIDPWLNKRCVELIGDRFNYFDSTKYDDRKFTHTFFNQVSTVAALSLLAKFENDIRNIEKEIVTYCYYKTSLGCNLIRETFQVIIGQSSNCVKAGDNLEITAGVGAFSAASQPKFTIGDKLISGDDNGIAIYKFKTPSKAGKHNKAVKIEYTRPDGSRESMTKNIEYTVIEEQ